MATSGTRYVPIIPPFMLFSNGFPEFVFASPGLVDRLTLTIAPGQPIGSTLEVDHAQPVFSGSARRISCDDDGIADLKSGSRNVGACQLATAGPLNGPTLHLSLGIRSQDVNERVWIAVQKLGEFSFDLHLLVQVVCSRERMVAIRSDATQERSDENENKRSGSHDAFSFRKKSLEFAFHT